MNEHQLLNDQAKELFKAFPELEFKTIAALSIVIGWLLTAANAQLFIAHHVLISRFGAGLAMGAFALAQGVFLWGHYNKLCTVHNRLSILTAEAGLSPIVADTYKISRFLPLSYACINIVFCAAIYVLVHLLSST